MRFRKFMRAHPFTCSLREQGEAAPAAGTAPIPPSDPTAPDAAGTGDNKTNDTTARNTQYGWTDEFADKVDTDFTIFQPMQYPNGKAVFPQHGWITPNLKVFSKKKGENQYELTFKYSLANPMLSIRVSDGSRPDPDELEDRTETVTEEMKDWIVGNGWLGGSKVPQRGEEQGASQGGDMMGVDPMGAAPGMQGGMDPMAGMMNTGQNPQVV